MIAPALWSGDNFIRRIFVDSGGCETKLPHDLQYVATSAMLAGEWDRVSLLAIFGKVIMQYSPFSIWTLAAL